MAVDRVREGEAASKPCVGLRALQSRRATGRPRSWCGTCETIPHRRESIHTLQCHPARLLER
jgi:hypothetical protein